MIPFSPMAHGSPSGVTTAQSIPGSGMLAEPGPSAITADRLTELLHEDAVQSMPPYSLWLQGRENLFIWWLGPGIGCRGSKLLPVGLVNGMPAWGQYKPAPDGGRGLGRACCAPPRRLGRTQHHRSDTTHFSSTCERERSCCLRLCL